MTSLPRPERPESQAYVAVHTPRSSHERSDAVVEEGPGQSTARPQQVSIVELFSFADTTDKMLMLVGTLGAFGAGVLRPVMVLLYRHIINEFGEAGQGETPTLTMSSVRSASLNFTIVGLVGFVAAYLQVHCWSVTASRQAKCIRSLYVHAILTKEIAWFDVNDPIQLSSRVADATIAIQDGMGSTMSDMLHFTSTVVSGIIIALVKGWELTLILMAIVPFVAASGMLAKKVIVNASSRSSRSYAEAGAMALESFINIRTVHMLNSVQHFVDQYARALAGATLAGIRKSVATGWGTGPMNMVQFLMYALGFFLGAVFVARDQLDGKSCSGSSCYDAGRIMTVFFSATKGTLAISQAGPSLQAVYSACAAAFDVLELIPDGHYRHLLETQSQALEEGDAKPKEATPPSVLRSSTW